ncbi:MAG: tocopherol cyclase family protein [Candidatus Izemoplasmatales bacterium]
MPPLRNVIHPEYFQGARKYDRYFEGWYYKLVTADGSHTIALIPGVSVNRDDPHAFVQVFVSRRADASTELRTAYVRFDRSAFSASAAAFSISVGTCRFDGGGLSVDLGDGRMRLSGEVRFSAVTPIRKTLFAPSIMGFFGYFGFLECYHGVYSMTHALSGTLLLDGKPVVFDGGKGYVEKDWGRSFPRSYVWIQSNHFTAPDASLMFSHADIPFLGMRFQGLIANLVAGGREYRFASYNLARVVRADIGEGTVSYELRKGRLLLEIDARSDMAVGLPSPREGRMVETIKEGLSGIVAVRLTCGKRVLFADEGAHAGIEIMRAPRKG